MNRLKVIESYAMKISLKDELDLLRQPRRGKFEEDLPDFKPSDEAKAQDFAREALAKVYATKPFIPQMPPNLKPGQVWQTRTHDKNFPSGPFGPKTFILTNAQKEEDHYEITGVPISWEWRFATPSDLFVGPGEGMPPAYDERIMIELRLETFLPQKELSRYLGEVSEQLFAKIQTLLTWIDGQEVEREFLGPEYVRAENQAPLGPPLESWTIKDPVTGQKHQVLMGQQIVGKDDPRLEYKKLSLEDQNYLVLPVVKKEQKLWEESMEKTKSEQIFQDILLKLGKLEEKINNLSNEVRSLNHKLDNSVNQTPADKWNEDVPEVPSKALIKIMKTANWH